MAQAFLNALIRASVISLIAIGLTMSYKMLKFANFAHVELVALGAYLVVLFRSIGLPIVLAGILSIVVTGCIGILVDVATFKKIRNANTVTLMITSFGVGIIIQNLLRVFWGTGIRDYAIGLQRPILFLGMRITMVQIWIIITACLSMIAFHLLLHRTRLGKAIRAIADDPALSQASGIDTEEVTRWVLFLVAGLAALGGILLGLDTQLSPRMGFAVIIPVFAATILGGIGNPYGAMVGALVLGMAENFGLYINWGRIITLNGLLGDMSLYIPTGYRIAISFGILIVVLLFYPSGIFGERSG